MSYNVVFQNIAEDAGIYRGVRTWTSFESKEHFKAWYDEKMCSWYEVDAEEVTPERAIELCGHGK